MALIGDLDYMNKFLGLPHWASAANPCNLCLCTKAGPLTWKDSRPNAPWRATTYTTGSWQANPDRSKNPIFDAANISGIVLPVWLHACKVSRVPAIFPGLSAVVASTWNFIGWTPCEHSRYLLWTGGQQLPMGHFLVQSDENGSSPGRVILAEAVWWLVSFSSGWFWNMNGLISPIVGMMIQSDELIFYRGVGIPPTSLGLSKYLVTSEKRRLRAMILGDGEKIHDRDFIIGGFHW